MVNDRLASSIIEHALLDEPGRRPDSHLRYLSIIEYFRPGISCDLNLCLKQRRKLLLIDPSVFLNDLVLIHLKQEVPYITPLCNADNALIRMRIDIRFQLIRRSKGFFCLFVPVDDRNAEFHRHSVDLAVLLCGIF